MSNRIIVDITEIYEIKDRKQRELAFYQEQLEELQVKMAWLNHEIKLTENIIVMIEQETVLDIAENLKKKR